MSEALLIQRLCPIYWVTPRQTGHLEETVTFIAQKELGKVTKSVIQQVPHFQALKIHQTECCRYLNKKCLACGDRFRSPSNPHLSKDRLKTLTMTMQVMFMTNYV